MTRSLRFCALFLAATLLNCATVQVGVVRAADYKLGYIDTERIFTEYQGTKSAQGQFNQDLEGWVKQLEAKKAEIDKLQKEFESQRLMLSDARRKEKEDELQARLSEYAQFERDIWGPTGKVTQRNEQLTRPIITRIKEVVEKIATAEGYSIIFDAADGNLVFGEASLDLTERVVNELNAAPEGTTPQH